MHNESQLTFASRQAALADAELITSYATAIGWKTHDFDSVVSIHRSIWNDNDPDVENGSLTVVYIAQANGTWVRTVDFLVYQGVTPDRSTVTVDAWHVSPETSIPSLLTLPTDEAIAYAEKAGSKKVEAVR